MVIEHDFIHEIIFVIYLILSKVNYPLLVAVADSDSDLDMVKPPISSHYEPVTTKGLQSIQAIWQRLKMRLTVAAVNNNRPFSGGAINVWRRRRLRQSVAVAISILRPYGVNGVQHGDDWLPGRVREVCPWEDRQHTERVCGLDDREGSHHAQCSVEKDDDQLLEEEVDYLRLVFIRLLSKMDECFRFIAECLASKESGGRGFVLNDSWSEYLRILKDLYDTSKVFDGAEEMFWTVLRFHKNMLSALVVAFVKRGGDHRWVLDNKGVTNFECRRHLAMILFPAVEEDFDMLHEMLIDRSQVLAESFEYIGRAKPESLRSGLFMEFKNEKATGPGVLREWFVLVSREIFDSRHALFVSCPNDCRRFYPNPASKVHPRHLEYFRFAGRVIALALLERVQVGIVFDRVFFAQLAGIRVSLEDIRDADPCLYRSCKQILEMDADFIDSDALGLTFVRELEELGCREVVELCPGGKNIEFNSQNREHYVDLLIQHCFVTSISEQVANFAQGLADILSSSKLQQFFQCLELEDLDWMLYGSENTISIEDWKAHTVYKDYKESDCQISWFWEDCRT
ncbi:E3 ubiquitin-protein [Vigna angularis]|uniref:HECT-type E3 ubiquitin transferase n=1 Tax=Phaseolus angularis TaxID=3914 RepID=A0A8T0K7T1_PHAAN|nr:E3 ubiquitin-protein [Vigna angularis]